MVCWIKLIILYAPKHKALAKKTNKQGKRDCVKHFPEQKGN